MSKRKKNSFSKADISSPTQNASQKDADRLSKLMKENELTPEIASEITAETTSSNKTNSNPPITSTPCHTEQSIAIASNIFLLSSLTQPNQA